MGQISKIRLKSVDEFKIKDKIQLGKDVKPDAIIVEGTKNK